MTFPIDAYVITFAVAVLTAFASLPLWRRVCEKYGLIDDPGERKIHHAPIVLAGGLAVCTGIIIPLLLGALAIQMDFIPGQALGALRYGFGRRVVQLLGILIGALGMLLLGLADDKYELKAGPKFAGQIAIAALVAACDIRITLFVPSVAFSYFITIFWILTVVNAFNFMDNMNGLAAGLGAIASLQFGLIASAHGQYLVALMIFLISGALIGFLPYNFPKATAFLGDSGSHVVGYLLAILAILPDFYSKQSPKVFAVVTPLLILALPLADLLSVVLIRWRMGKPFYIGDNNHLSHRLVRAGCTRSQAVIAIWAIATVIGSAALLVTL
jgi:UDP-GlcNAc:undecaprenyl-phosphate GlcNAc-1-phosphate transferase